LVSRSFPLEFDLLSEPKRIVNFHPEMAYGRFDLCVSEQELYRPQVAGLPIELRDFGSTQRVSAEPAVVQPDVADPPVDDASVLSCGDVSAPASTAPEQVAIC